MRKRKLKIFLTPTENSIVIQSLNHLRNALLRENRDTGCLDELLLKVMCAPVKKMYNYISLLNEPLILFRKSKRLFSCPSFGFSAYIAVRPANGRLNL